MKRMMMDKEYERDKRFSGLCGGVVGEWCGIVV